MKNDTSAFATEVDDVLPILYKLGVGGYLPAVHVQVRDEIPSAVGNDTTSPL